ncbi:hypothetical protein ACLKA6_010068 [Drosophila palustris]
MAGVQLVTLCLLLSTVVSALAKPEDATEAATDAAASEAIAHKEEAGNQTETSTQQVTNSSTAIAAVTELIDLMTYKPSGEQENGGDPFVSPDGHKRGARHVRAHDGFHNIKNEPLWAHWNDVFTKTTLLLLMHLCWAMGESPPRGKHHVVTAHDGFHDINREPKYKNWKARQEHHAQHHKNENKT